MKRNATAVWQGSIKEGKGAISTPSGVLKEAQYGFAARFENGVGTNPEELIAAAHSGCFSMALSGQLGALGAEAEKIETTATVTLDKVEGGFAVTGIHLDVQVKLSKGGQAEFDKATTNAKEGCPISKLMKAPITMTAKLL